MPSPNDSCIHVRDEENEAKRPFNNMDDKTSKEAEVEPTLWDLKAMLLDLQGSVNSILKDNKSLKDEISALKT